MAAYEGKRVLFVEQGKVEVSPWEQEAPKDDEVALQNVASLISAGTELSILYGTHMRQWEFPRNTGYMSVARVLECGSGVTNVKPGDHVLCGMGHFSHLTAPAAGLAPIPENLAPEHAVFCHLAAISLRAVRQAELGIGDGVYIAGLGLIGQFAQMFARLNGGFPVVAVDPSAYRRGIAAETGLPYCFAPGDPAMANTVASILPDGLYRACIDSTGTPDVLASLPEITAEFGSIIILGGVHRSVSLDCYTHIQKRSLRMIGAGRPDPRNFPYGNDENKATILNLMQAGLLNVKPLLTDHIDPEQAPEMYRILHEEKDRSLGVVIRWS